MFSIVLLSNTINSLFDIFDNSDEFILNVVIFLSNSNCDGFIYVVYSVNSRSSKSPQLTVRCFAGINSFGLPTGKFFGYDSREIHHHLEVHLL